MHVGTGPDEPLLVEGDTAAVEPGCNGIGAGEDEQVGDSVLFLGTGALVAPPHALQSLVGRAEELNDLGLTEHRDVRRTRYPFYEVARHGAREAWPAHQHAHVTRVACEEHGRLPRRVSSTHQGHVLIAAEPGLDGRGPVRDAAALELREVRNLRTAIARAGGHHDRARPDPPPVGKLDDVYGIGPRTFRRAVQPRHL